MFKAASIKLGLDYAVMHNMDGKVGRNLNWRNTNVTLPYSQGLFYPDKRPNPNPTPNNTDEKVMENNPNADDDEEEGSGQGRKSKSKSGQKQGLGVNSNLDGVTSERAEYVSNMSKKELENLLKHGAYDIFREEKDGQAEAESNR